MDTPLGTTETCNGATYRLWETGRTGQVIHNTGVTGRDVCNIILKNVIIIRSFPQECDIWHQEQWCRKMFCCRGAENTVHCGGFTSGLSSQ